MHTLHPLTHGIRRALLGSGRFRPADLFRSGEGGFHFETYDPTALVQRRNQVLWSEDFSNGLWAANGSTVVVTTDAANDATGQLTLDRIDFSTGGAGDFRYQHVTITGGVAGTWTASMDLYSPSKATIALRVASTDNGSADSFVRSIALAAGVTRVSVTGTLSGAGATSSRIDVGLDNRTAQGGDGIAGFVYAGRVQLERGAAASAYQKVTDWNTEYIAAVGAANIFMWQDTAETLAVYGIEQPVGKWKDKSGRGNHATQSTTTKRPILSARYNRLTKTENLADTSVWTSPSGGNGYQGTGQPAVATANYATAPNGTMTATRIQMDLGGGASATQAANRSGISCVVSAADAPINQSFRQGIYLKANDGTDLTKLGLAQDANQNTILGLAVGGTQSFTLVPVGGGWYYASGNYITGVSGGTFRVQIMSRPGSTLNTLDLLVWGADFRTADDAAKNIPAYQAVRSSTDYDTAGFPFYLKSDGLDDHLVLPTMDFTAFDKVTVWAGVSKQSDAASGAIVEHSANSSSTNGTFLMTTPSTASGNNFFWRSKGTVQGGDVTSGALYASPFSGVALGIGDIGGANSQLRVNGVAAATGSASQGTGSFSNNPAYIGSRAGTSLFFNGRIHSITVRASTTPTSEAFIAKMNRYCANLGALVF